MTQLIFSLHFSVRGALVSSVIFALNCGRLVAYVFGTYFEFWALPALAMTILITFIVLFCFLPESPFVLLKENRIHVSNEIQLKKKPPKD